MSVSMNHNDHAQLKSISAQFSQQPSVLIQLNTT